MPVFELNHLYLEPRYLALLQHILHQQVPHAEVWAYGYRVLVIPTWIWYCALQPTQRLLLESAALK